MDQWQESEELFPHSSQMYFPSLRSNEVIKTFVSNIDVALIRPSRAGIIMYTSFHGQIYLGVGLDAQSHDLTDFGGRVQYAIDGNAICGAIREFEEETLHIFDPLTEEMLSHSPVIYDRHNLIIFLHLDIHPDVISKAFQDAFHKQCHRRVEVCGITWLSWAEFQHCLFFRSNFFVRVEKFLRRAGDFSYLL